MRAGLEAEDPDNASRARVPPQLRGEIGGRPHVSGIVRAHVTREQEPVAADAGVDRDVLFAVRPAKRDRRAHDAGADLELPQLPAGARVRGLEPAVECAVEDDVPRGDDAAAPHWKLLLDLPDRAAARRIPGYELARVPAGPGVVRRRRADLRRPRNPRDGRGFEVHAEIVRRRVEQPGARRISGWRRGALTSLEARADSLYVA